MSDPIPNKTNDYAVEALLCAESLAYFCHNYGCVQSGSGEWVKFELWPKQVEVCDILDKNRFAAILKARQLGLSWIAVHEALQTLLFKPGSKVGLFSLRENESKDLLKRVRSVYNNLPAWMKPAKGIAVDAATEFQLAHGSRCLAFSTNSGDSYTFDLVIVDEADLAPDLDRMLRSVKPTIDAGGRIRLISRSNKKLPVSTFKRIYVGARKGQNSYKAIFLPWNSRPDRTNEWYEGEKRDSLVNTGSLDYIYEQYPADDSQALAANVLDKRIPIEWLDKCYIEIPPLIEVGPSVPGLMIYNRPEKGRTYAIGIDTSEGNPTSDDSALVVGDVLTGEEVAMLRGKFQPSVLAAYAVDIARYFNKAVLLPERNNHGHALILAVSDHRDITILQGPDGKHGWVSTAKGNALIYSTCADAFRNGETRLHSFDAYSQLAAIEGATLAAPTGLHDDIADAYALMLQAILISADSRWVPPPKIESIVFSTV